MSDLTAIPAPATPNQTSPEATSKQISSHASNNFDFLRFVLAASVILSHSFWLSANQKLLDPLAILTRSQTTLGGASVWCFFTISGFLITASWQKSRALPDYLIKRVLRIYPGFIVASAFSVFIAGAISAQNVGVYFEHIRVTHVVIRALMLKMPEDEKTYLDNLRPGVLNGSMWTIAAEFECYFLTALLGMSRAFKKPAFAVFLLGICLASNSYISIEHPNMRFPSVFFTTHLPWITYYLVGTVFLLYRDRIPMRPIFAVAALVLVLVGCRFHSLPEIGPLPLGYLLIYFAFVPIPKINRFAKHFDPSYGTYLYGYPVQQALLAMLGAGVNPYVLTFLALPTAFCFSGASWYGVEKPFLKMRPKPSVPIPV